MAAAAMKTQGAGRRSSQAPESCHHCAEHCWEPLHPDLLETAWAAVDGTASPRSPSALQRLLLAERNIERAVRGEPQRSSSSVTNQDRKAWVSENSGKAIN